MLQVQVDCLCTLLCFSISNSGSLTFREEEIAVIELNSAGRRKLNRTHPPTEPGSLYNEVILHYPQTIRNGLTLKYL
jgi:hypothetical protein